MHTHFDSIDRVVLIGFMGSGKSMVGAALARRLEWDFVDFDVEIERREGRSVSQLVEANGETYLRELETILTAEIGRSTRLVAAPGGGWITQPELLDSIRGATFTVWLRVGPDEIARRLRSGPAERPPALRNDAAATIGEMLKQREPLYRLADLSCRPMAVR